LRFGHVVQQGSGASVITDLTCGDEEAERPTIRIGQRVELGAGGGMSSASNGARAVHHLPTSHNDVRLQAIGSEPSMIEMSAFC